MNLKSPAAYSMFYRTVIVLASLPLLLSAADTPPHWAFQPLAPAPPPAVKDTAWAKTDIDRFFLAVLEKAGRQPATAADPRSLLRRVTYDLTGLPPTPEEAESFTVPDLPTVVDRLLASPAYGEKWGREWLDVVRYADTAGETADVPMPHAWRYRNWVIKAFNDDLPYDDFVRWQIAGDLLSAGDPPDRAAEKTVATGFLAIARRFGFDIEKDMHLTYEDTLDTLGKSFMGLTLGCARCHDHKYDPVSQRDYYALYGILQSTRFPFTGCEKTPRPRDLVAIQSGDALSARKKWGAEMAAADAAVKEREAALMAMAAEFAASPVTLIAEGVLEPGASAVWSPEGTAGTLTLAEGETLQLSVLPRENHGADATGVDWVISETEGEKRTWSPATGFAGNPEKPAAEWSVFSVDQEPRLCAHFEREFEKTPGLACWRGMELWPSLLINTRPEPVKFQTLTTPPRSTALHPGPRGGIALAWHSPLAGSVSLRLAVSEIDPGGDGVAWKLERRPSLAPLLDRQRPLAAAQQEAANVRTAIAHREPATDWALAMAEAKPVNARLQKKGEPKDPGDEVPRGMLSIFGGAAVPADAGSGRLQLADSLTRGAARDLTARVMVNRLWQGHFGHGLVTTPNDFGTRGQPPSDPALLDFLAAKFLASGWSVKAMHRMMILSATWQRASDGSNQLSVISNQKEEPQITRSLITDYFPLRRLTAEELRDTLLLLGGNLDRTPGGAHPFPAEGTWAFTQHGPFNAVYDSSKRSVYLMVQRTRRHPFLALFDGGDPNASTPVRSQSTVPTQALFFLNDPFFHTQAANIAKSLSGLSSDPARVRQTFRAVLQRDPTPPDGDWAAGFLSDYPAAADEKWLALCRVLLAGNEFMHVD